MSKREDFVTFVDYLIENCKVPVVVPEDVKSYLDAIRDSNDRDEKPLFTSNGSMILKHMQGLTEGMYKARDIAEGMCISSKAVSGAIRKLVTDGFVEKVGMDPVIYTLTEKGKNYIFDEGQGE